MRSQLIPMLLVLLATTPAYADDSGEQGGSCEFLGNKLAAKAKVWRMFWESNEQRKSDLQTLETRCRDNGAELSKRVATLALSLSCTAELDASGMDKQLNGLGADCTAHFVEVKTLEIEMRAAFETELGDLARGRDFAWNSELLREDCGEELQQADKLLGNYRDLMNDMLNVVARAEKGRGDYQHFTDTASTLTASTRSRGTGCGADFSSALATLGSGGALQGKSGPAQNPESTITGVEKAQAQESASQQALLANPGVAGGATGSAGSPTALIAPEFVRTAQAGNRGSASGASLAAAFDSSSTAASAPLSLPHRGSPGVMASPQGDSAILLSYTQKILVPVDFDSAAASAKPATAAESIGAAIWQNDASGKSLELATDAQSDSIFTQVSKRYRQQQLFLETAGARFVSN